MPIVRELSVLTRLRNEFRLGFDRHLRVCGTVLLLCAAGLYCVFLELVQGRCTRKKRAPGGSPKLLKTTAGREGFEPRYAESEGLDSESLTSTAVYGCAITIRVGTRVRAQRRHSPRVSGSRAPKLSSRIVRSAPCNSARAINRRLRSPCDNCHPVSPTI